MAMEQISFHKFPGMCEFEPRHGVNIGTNYTTETSATPFIALAQQRNWVLPYSRPCKFFSILLDGSTDSRNIENELLLVVWFDKDSQANGERVVRFLLYQ